MMNRNKQYLPDSPRTKGASGIIVRCTIMGLTGHANGMTQTNASPKYPRQLFVVRVCRSGILEIMSWKLRLRIVAIGLVLSIIGISTAQAEYKNIAQARDDVAQEFVDLLGRYPSADAVDENGWTDLHWAAVLNLPKLADMLLEAGVNVDRRIEGGF